MSFSPTNAEASSSRVSPKLDGDTRSLMSQKDQIKPNLSIRLPKNSPTLMVSPTSPSNIISPTSAGPSQSRKVRTVPPSAKFDPPSPPTSTHITPPVPSASDPSSAITKPKRPKLRVRYSTSSGSSADVSDDEDDDDDDVPWWTFTHKGMMKMRARSMKRNESEPGEGSGVGEGDSDPRPPMRKLPSSSRKSSKDHTPLSSLRAEFTNRRRSSSPNKTPKQKSILTQSPALRLPSNLSFLRPSSRIPNDSEDIPVTRRLTRRNSAPESPISIEPLDSIASVLPSPEPIALDGGEVMESPSDITAPPRISTKRQMTAPVFPFRRRLGDQEHLTDSEAHMIASPRVKAKAKTMFLDTQPVFTDSPADTPIDVNAPRPATRRKYSKLRIGLPPPLSQHFQHGWPHAGTWQDALYGHFDEEAYNHEVHDRRRSSNHSDTESRRPTINHLNIPRNSPLAERNLRPPPNTPNPHHHSQTDEDAKPRKSRLRKTKSRRKRYRDAIAPPTPRGLGFTDDEQQPQPQPNGFDWSNNKEARNTVMTNGDGNELDRADTRAKDSLMEKSSISKKRFIPWLPWRRDKPKRKIVVPDEGWKARLRRILFLDARLTIWMRAFNLVVATCLLALSSSIRLEQYDIHLPGIIGASTTLTIAYAALTVVHVLTAIYREYFGRPIGLWGLRSKMLWVSLDLLFVAFWSSAMTLAINDFISTPLECTPAGPWWRADLYDNYSSLLDSLGPIDQSLDGISPAQSVSMTMGIVLPSAVLDSKLASDICQRQAACIALSLLALLVYASNMVLSLFRIFEVIKRAADVGRAVKV